MEMLVCVWTFILGAVLGSFLGVVIWRVPNHISLVNPSRSFCETCHNQIAWYDNIPIISYCVLRGRCRHCHTHLSIRYPIMELLTACSMTAVVAGAFSGLYSFWMLPDLLYLAAISIVVAYIDLDTHLILNVIVIPSYAVSALCLVLASAMTGQWGSLGRAAICGLALAVFYFILGIIWPGGMGDGDVKLSLLLGATLGWLGIKQFAIGAFMPFLVGGLVALVTLLGKGTSTEAPADGGGQTEPAKPDPAPVEAADAAAAEKGDAASGDAAGVEPGAAGAQSGPVSVDPDTGKLGIPFGPSMVIGTWIGIFAGVWLADLYLRLVGLA